MKERIAPSEELAKALLKGLPKEVLESMEKALKKDTNKKDKKMTNEEEYKMIEAMESTIIDFIMVEGEDLSVNGTLLLMFNIMTGIELALKDTLGEEDFNQHKNVVMESKRLQLKKQEEYANKILQEKLDFVDELLKKFGDK